MLGRGAGFLCLGLIMLSLVPLIGWAGQVSFANFAIAGFGAAMYAHVGGQHGHPIGIVFVILLCAPLGVLIALPALRLKGLYLALATMAFAFAHWIMLLSSFTTIGECGTRCRGENKVPGGGRLR